MRLLGTPRYVLKIMSTSVSPSARAPFHSNMSDVIFFRFTFQASLAAGNRDSLHGIENQAVHFLFACSSLFATISALLGVRPDKSAGFFLVFSINP